MSLESRRVNTIFIRSEKESQVEELRKKTKSVLSHVYFDIIFYNVDIKNDVTL